MALISPHILSFKSPPPPPPSLANPFLNGAASPATRLHIRAPTTSSAALSSSPALPVIKAMRTMQGKVVCSTNDKTVAVEVVRLAPHPKYMRRVRKKKTYQAHDPLNQFKVGDFVQLEKGRPVSKNKTFYAVSIVGRAKAKDEPETPQELGIPLESQS